MSLPPQGGEHEEEFLIVLCPSLAAEETTNGDRVSLLLAVSTCIKKGVTACVLWAKGRQQRGEQKRKFSTFRLRECGVTHMVMESTGVYWKPSWDIWKGQFQRLLVNAQHVKAIPGPKTDRRGSKRFAQLLQHGLVRGSFIPPEPIREPCDLTRYRVTLVQDCNRVANRIQNDFSALLRRLAARRGGKRATIAVAHSLLVIADEILKNGVEYHELGADYFDRLNLVRLTPGLVKHLESLGFQVMFETRPA